MANAHSYKITYFNVEALAEPLRWIFHYKGVPFEDDRIPFDLPTWFSQRKQGFTNSVGQIPVLTIDGKNELCQSSAISRYLAGEFDLLGDTNWDRARGDEIISLVFDLFHAWRTNAFERDPERKATTQPIVDQKFRLYYSKFESILKETDGDFVNGKKLTHADFWLTSFLNTWNNPLKRVQAVLPQGAAPLNSNANYIGLVDEYPALKKHLQKVLEIPQIKNWISIRP